MAISKIILNGVTQIDLTQDTVDVDKLLASYIAHKNDGTVITGTAQAGGGGDEITGPTYSLETLVPETTITPTGETTLLYSGVSLEAGANYLVTVNGTKRINTAVIAEGNLSLADQDYMNAVTSPSPWIDSINNNLYFSTKQYGDTTYTVKIEKLTLNNSGGVLPYTLTTIIPAQTVTPTTRSDDTNRAFPTSIGLLEEGADYLITFDGAEYWSTCTILYDTYPILGEVNYIWSASELPYPFCILYDPGESKYHLCTYTTDQCTIKVEKIELNSGNGGDNSTVWLTLYSDTATIVADSPNYIAINNFTETIEEGDTWRVTWNGDTYTLTPIYNSEVGWGMGNPGAAGGTDDESDVPFVMYKRTASQLVFATSEPAGSVQLVIERQTRPADEVTLITKTITANGTYSASDDSADGYSEVTVSIPNGTAGTPTATKGIVSNNSVTITPSVTNTTGYITGGTLSGTGVTVSASELVSGNLEISQNGTGIDVTNYASVSVSVPSGTAMNVQTEQSTTRRNNTSLGSITSLTCSKTGTYDVLWTCARSSTSQTWGSQLYINDTAYGTENTSWSNNVQNNHLTGVSITANDTVAVYGRSRSGYYIYVPQLTIIQTA